MSKPLAGNGNGGGKAALDSMMPLVYRELRNLAQAHLRGERPDHTLQPTALVHEVYMRLAGQEKAGIGETHFLALASRVMRRVLVDHAVRRKAKKRPEGGSRIPLEEHLQVAAPVPVDVLDLDRALSRLAEVDPRQARIVELRFFGGLTREEIASALGLSVATVERDCSTARLWLARELDPGRGV